MKQNSGKSSETLTWVKNEFTSCMNSEETRQMVISNIETAKEINVNSTPSLFTNGRKVKYWNSPEVIRAIIKEEQAE